VVDFGNKQCVAACCSALQRVAVSCSVVQWKLTGCLELHTLTLKAYTHTYMHTHAHTRTHTRTHAHTRTHLELGTCTRQRFQRERPLAHCNAGSVAVEALQCASVAVCKFQVPGLCVCARVCTRSLSLPHLELAHCNAGQTCNLRAHTRTHAHTRAHTRTHAHTWNLHTATLEARETLEHWCGVIARTCSCP